jgi:hypothetical protein
LASLWRCKFAAAEFPGAVLGGEPADHLGAALNLAERLLEQVCAAPPAAVPGGVAQMHDERVGVVGEAFGGGGVAGTFELVDQAWSRRLASVELMASTSVCQ